MPQWPAELWLSVLAGTVLVLALMVGVWWRAVRQQTSAQARALLAEERLAHSQQLLATLQQEHADLQEQQQQAAAEAARYQRLLEVQQSRQQADKEHLQEKIQLLEQAEERMQKEFERLADRIFTAKSQHLTQRSQQSLDQTISPLKSTLESFRQQLAQQHNQESNQRSMLQQELLSLKELNQQMTREAEALTRALKGDTKQQGAWGEMVLERILEQSGLRAGYEYEVQGHRKHTEGGHYRPDVIVHLPDQKDVIIDAKVSLVAYERYYNAATDEERASALQEHVQSVRQHIKGLGRKSYQHLDGVRTLDYVLLFIPVEPAFLLAVDKDPGLIRLALDEQIMLVSPTNLLVALRTVHNIWQYEKQNENAQRIAQDAGRLYDKFVGFLDDMQKLEGSLNTSYRHYEAAMNKLSRGRGNLVSRVEKFREFGVNPAKQIESSLLEADADELSGSDSGTSGQGADKGT